MALYVFLDEAGNLHDDRDRHGVLVAFVTGQPKATRKCFVRAKQTKLPRKYQHYAEIKFRDRVIPDDFKKHVLRQISRTEIQIYALVVVKEHLPSEYRAQAEGIIYCDLVGQLLELCTLGESDEVYLFLDRRSLQGLTRQEFDARLRQGLLLHLREGKRRSQMNCQTHCRLPTRLTPKSNSNGALSSRTSPSILVNSLPSSKILRHF